MFGLQVPPIARISTSSVQQKNSWDWRNLSAAELVEAAPPSARPYLRLMRFDKPIGTWLLYWPCTWSIALAAPAGSLPSLTHLTLFGIRSCVHARRGLRDQRPWDKDFDRKVARTKIRPLASGELTNLQATALLAALLSTSLTILLQLNWLTVGIGCSSMLLVCSYPLAKRFTHWPQAVLGSIFPDYPTFYCPVCSQDSRSTTAPSWATRRRRGTFDAATILPLYAASICWTMVYDTIYAHQDKADDSLIGVGSTALRFGDRTKLWLSGFAAGMVGNLWALGLLTDQPTAYYAGVAAVAAHLAWQIGTVDINNSEDCWRQVPRQLVDRTAPLRRHPRRESDANAREKEVTGC
ncbi:4-hydroxybenzoate polyprenyltransferase, mitochondrial [Aphelenchoides fujianensis]|nr:4-hydroxybenzoate polyprenyltransferase, mitochondrial [Aphelenchoides fujianensis]